MIRNLAGWLRAIALGIAMGAAPGPLANDLDSLRQRALAGDADAQYVLASRLHRGEGVARDDVEARALVLKAARQGHLEAQRSLGLYYWRSYGGPQDKVEALKWILVAERGGNKDASNVRAGMVKSMSPDQIRQAQARADAEPPRELARAAPATAPGAAAPRSPAFDVARFRAAASRGDRAAQTTLGAALLYGRGVAADEAEGLKWLREAAAQDDLLAMAFLGGAYIEGVGVPRNSAEGIALMAQAAERGSAPAAAMLGQYYFQGEWLDRDDEISLKWARKAAEQGDSQGQRLLAAHYLAGRGVPQDQAKATEWLRKAADQGDEKAQRVLASLGTVPSNSPEGQAAGVAFVRKAAESGSAVAQYQLSRWYAEGFGVPKDKKLEVEWERKAAEQDHVEALGSHGWRLIVTHDGVKPDFWKGYSYLYRAGALGHAQSRRALGMLYQKGMGVKKDLVISLVWYEVAARAGDARAKELREEALKEASAGQVAEAERRAVAWMKRPPRERTTPEGAP